MKKISLLLFLALLFIAASFAEETPASLSLSIKTDKETYAPNEKIKITFGFKNISDKEIKFLPLPFGSMYNKNWINVYAEEGELMKGYNLATLASKPALNKKVVTLKPQEEYFSDLNADIKLGSLPYLIKQKGLYLDFGDSVILLSRGFGKYKLKADLSFYLDFYYEGNKEIEDKELWRGSLTSNSLIIEILKVKKASS